jgi:protein-tyrosine phosphatase
VRILFVCSANIVRSFMAERVLKSRLKRCGIQAVEVSSILQENGIDDEGHQSRFLNEAIIGEADLIVTMEQEQLQRIGEQYPLAMDKLRILKSYLPDTDHGNIAGDIKDPYRRSIFDYRLCFAEISLSVEELIKCI